MNVIISNSTGKPIYEQIVDQIRNQIMEGKLISGDALPSMRTLAQGLRVSVITTKRAYSELELEGLIETVPGKGSFISNKDPDTIREANLRIAEKCLEKAVAIAKGNGIGKEELTEILGILYEDD
ncbi:MAG: GntR family transcriptional regulator [Candidatus Methanomethylophilaceae archaeon]|nr:GntR family transcriptional regulator [Candidatus Methanomethylophilaceae archaeon]